MPAKKVQISYRCTHRHHDQTRPWANTVAETAYEVEVVTTQKRGSTQTSTYRPVCPDCALDLPGKTVDASRGTSAQIKVRGI